MGYCFTAVDRLWWRPAAVLRRSGLWRWRGTAMSLVFAEERGPAERRKWPEGETAEGKGRRRWGYSGGQDFVGEKKEKLEPAEREDKKKRKWSGNSVR